MIAKDELSSVDIEVDFSKWNHKKCTKKSVENIYIDIWEKGLRYSVVLVRFLTFKYCTYGFYY